MSFIQTYKYSNLTPILKLSKKLTSILNDLEVLGMYSGNVVLGICFPLRLLLIIVSQKSKVSEDQQDLHFYHILVFLQLFLII